MTFTLFYDNSDMHHAHVAIHFLLCALLRHQDQQCSGNTNANELFSFISEQLCAIVYKDKRISNNVTIFSHIKGTLYCSVCQCCFTAPQQAHLTHGYVYLQFCLFLFSYLSLALVYTQY